MELVEHSMWWNGPHFLSKDQNVWPPITTPVGELDSSKIEEKQTLLLIVTPTHILDQLLLKFSSLQKILRIVAYCMRITKKSKYDTIILSPIELANALKIVILAIQQQTFTDELSRIQNQHFKGVSKLQGLNLFLDENGIIRVGGRLNHANIPYEQKHPILLPGSHRFTDLLIESFHKQFKHPGATTLQSIIQQQYWIVSSRRVIRSRLRHCLVVIRFTLVDYNH